MIPWLESLNKTVLGKLDTQISGGYPEPFYRAATKGKPAEIQFTYDYVRSALHELAHWCVAGNKRRQQDDYGYWYEADGRSNEQQQLFFQVEVVPQAIEKHFCEAAGISFDISSDNLNTKGLDGIPTFRTAVDAKYQQFAEAGLPGQAAVISRHIASWQNKR